VILSNPRASNVAAMAFFRKIMRWPELVPCNPARQYDSKTRPRSGAPSTRETAGNADSIRGARMKTILVPTEQGATMASALETAFLLAQKFDSFIEGFPLRPAVADLV